MLYDRDEKPRSAGEASLLSLLSGSVSYPTLASSHNLSPSASFLRLSIQTTFFPTLKLYFAACLLGFSILKRHFFVLQAMKIHRPSYAVSSTLPACLHLMPSPLLEGSPTLPNTQGKLHPPPSPLPKAEPTGQID